MTRGRLRIYLGAAPGVGKTFDMLCEAHRRGDRGTDVVVGLIETHGRPRTAALVDGLEVVPRRTVQYRGATFSEMDVDAIVARKPAVVLIDELAHTNVPEGRNEKRWQDVAELLDAGIDVLSTLNIQHLESLNDVVETITGVSQRETVPDAVVRAAEQVELVDMTPEALRRRLAHGNVYSPEKIDAALGNYFRVGNLTTLRELALLWLADKVDDQLDRYRADHGITGLWETRERVVVALTGGPEGGTLIRRAARIADRMKGADLLAVHVTRSDGLTGASSAHLAAQRALLAGLGNGSYHQVGGDDVPTALLDFARAENATLLVLGASRRGRLAHMLDPGIGVTTTAMSGPIDVLTVTHEQVASGRRLPRPTRGLTVRRRLAGVLAAAVLLPLLTLLLAAARTTLNLTSDALAFLVVVVAVALVGGLLPASLAAVGGSLLDYYFVPPMHQLTIAERNNLLALLVFLAVAAMVSGVVDLAARQTSQAVRASGEAEMLSTLAGSVLRGERALPALLERVREAFGMSSVALLERATEGVLAPIPPGGESDRGGWQVVDSVGPDPCRRPHDLRSPLASASAAVANLLSDDVTLTDDERKELLALTDESLERLTRLVENLLDMSRLQAGRLSVFPGPVGLDDVIPGVLKDLEPAARGVAVKVSDDLPCAYADPALLEQVLANLVANAIRYSPPDRPPLISASALGDRIELRVVDRGPGLPREHRDQVFTPFQRLGDTDDEIGVGLGLALSRGLTEAMGGTLIPEDTPGGGLTMVVTLPAAEVSAAGERHGWNR